MDTIFDKKDHHRDGGSIVGTRDHPEDFKNGVNDTDPDYDYQGPPTQLMKVKSPRPSRRHPRKAK